MEPLRVDPSLEATSNRTFEALKYVPSRVLEVQAARPLIAPSRH